MHIIKILFGFVLIMMTGIGVIQADDDEGIPLFNDGRVNNWQIDEPVAVFCVFSEVDGDTSVFERTEVWGLNNAKLLEANAGVIDAAEGAAVLDSAVGFTLETLADGSFEVSTPGGYVFNWERGDAGC